MANRGYKTSNIPLVNEYSIPDKLKEKLWEEIDSCIVGHIAEPSRLFFVHSFRLTTIKENEKTNYVDLESMEKT